MSNLQRYAAGVVGVGGLIVALVAISGSDALLALSSSLGGAAALGWYQQATDDRENDERYMAINYRAGYVAFWAVYWFLFIFALAGLRGTGGGGAAPELPVEAHTVALAAWLLGTVAVIGAKTWYKRRF